MAESYPTGLKTPWEKGEIACYEQFLLFPQCFQKACFPGASKGVNVWEWVIVSKEKVFKEKISDAHTDGQTHDEHNAMTVALWPLAIGAKKLGGEWTNKQQQGKVIPK